MKRIIILLVIFLIPATCLAHGGRTNEDGCHHNRKTGEYHCHGQTPSTHPQGGPSNTYDRKQFGNWIDADGDCQNTRHEVLIEESFIPVTFKTSRQYFVISGEWHAPYTGRVFTDPSMLDVDTLSHSRKPFLSGAQEWSSERMRQYANELNNNDHLIAVYRGANRSKGAKDPAHWLPPTKSIVRSMSAFGVRSRRNGAFDGLRGSQSHSKNAGGIGKLDNVTSGRVSCVVGRSNIECLGSGGYC